MTLPSKSITFKVQENEYTVNYPNNGQLIEIESMKARLTGDSYNAISQGETTAAQFARFTVDMIAFFSTCCPNMKKQLNVATFSELDALSSKKLLNVYIKTILPWMMDWEKVLNTEDEIEEKKA